MVGSPSIHKVFCLAEDNLIKDPRKEELLEKYAGFFFFPASRVVRLYRWKERETNSFLLSWKKPVFMLVGFSRVRNLTALW